MSSLKPKDRTPPIRAEPAVDRFCTCAAWLYVHGFLTDAERGKVKKRLQKWVAKNRKAAG